MTLGRPFSIAPVSFALVACGGMTISQAEDTGKQSGEAAAIPDGIPMGPSRPAGAVGTNLCTPLAQPSTFDVVAPTKATLVGRTSSHTIYVIDDDPDRPGRRRAFIARGTVLERHALSEDAAFPGRFIIDRGLPNQIVLTSTTIQGAGTDGPFTPALPEQLAVVGTFANDSPESLAFAPSDQFGIGKPQLFVLGPVSKGALAVPRVFYGPPDAIQERTFMGFGPSDSSAKATAATSVTFDLDGTPTTMPTVVTRETQGLINGFSTGALRFYCF